MPPSRPTMTTRIVGEQEQFDQSNIAFARVFRGDLGPKVQARWTSPWGDALTRSQIQGTPNNFTRHLVRLVDGPVFPEAIPVPDPAAMSVKIKEIARFFGAHLVGIAELDQAYVYSHTGVRHDPEVQTPGTPIRLNHKYAIVIGFAMDYEKLKASPSWIDNAEVGQRYADVGKIVCQLAGFIRESGYPARAHHFREEQVLHVPLAVNAGLGELGRNGYLVTPEFGPRLRLGSVTTDLPLVADKPIDLGIQDFCEKCKKCADNCPSRSIPSGPKTVVRGAEKWALNADACVRYWVAYPEQSMCCSLCITTCPWNKPNTWYHRLSTRLAARSSLSRSALLWLDDVLYGKRPRYRVRWLDYVKEPGDKKDSAGEMAAVGLDANP